MSVDVADADAKQLAVVDEPQDLIVRGCRYRREIEKKTEAQAAVAQVADRELADHEGVD
jgi:hypothetical protein